MRNIARKTISIGLAGVISLLLAGSPVQAQQEIPTFTVTNTYAAKFICGVQPDASIKIAPDAQAGHYSSKINVHNNTGQDIKFRKKVIRLKGGQVPTPPAWPDSGPPSPDWRLKLAAGVTMGHWASRTNPRSNLSPLTLKGSLSL